jgi:ProP effector
MNAARKSHDTAVAATLALLAKTFPKCFSVFELRRRPLKLRIDLDIAAALAGAITPVELNKALGVYCANQIYLEHVRVGVWRIDLDGNPAGSVSADEEAHAKAKLAGMRAKQARTVAAKGTAKPVTAQPRKRLSLADLKAAALARKQAS